MITGIDYLTGVEAPLDELRVVTKEKTDSERFPKTESGFPGFAALFVRKFGVSNSGQPPIVLTDESLAVVRSYFKATDGEIRRVDERKARKSW